MRRTLVLAVALLLALAKPVAAACTTETITIGLRTIICTTCCDANGNCHTTCF